MGRNLPLVPSFRHLNSLAFELHIAIARDRMIIDREQNIAGAEKLRAWTGGDDGTYQHAAANIKELSELIQEAQCERAWTAE